MINEAQDSAFQSHLDSNFRSAIWPEDISMGLRSPCLAFLYPPRRFTVLSETSGDFAVLAGSTQEMAIYGTRFAQRNM
jgi:hypothetical protein